MTSLSTQALTYENVHNDEGSITSPLRQSADKRLVMTELLKCAVSYQVQLNCAKIVSKGEALGMEERMMMMK